MLRAIDVANKELKTAFVTEEELHELVYEQINGPAEDSLKNNIPKYFDRKEDDVGSQVKVEMSVARRGI